MGTSSYLCLEVGNPDILGDGVQPHPNWGKRVID
jgi:hypothetical protein